MNASNKPTPGIAVAALVLSFLCPPVGVVLGIVAYSKIKNSRGALGGDGLALAAIVVPAAMVPVVAILAAIAVPNFIRYKLRAQQSEAKVVLRSIQLAQEGYFAEHNVYFSGAANPSTPGFGKKQAWEPRPCPSNCGPDDAAACTEFACADMDPGQPLFYQYACTASGPDADGNAFYTCAAAADLDSDGAVGALLIGSGEGTIVAPIPEIARGHCPEDAPAGRVFECQKNEF